MANRYDEIIKNLGGRYSDDLLVGPTLNEAHLRKIESDIGYSLSSDYREFLHNYAGIMFSYVIFPVFADSHQVFKSIFMFYGSKPERTLADTYHRIQHNYDYLESEDGHEWYPGIHLVRDVPAPVLDMEWPPELLPIGSDQGGNQICLALFGLRPGAIFFWTTAPSEFADNLYLVADSFDEFMHLLERPANAA